MDHYAGQLFTQTPQEQQHIKRFYDIIISFCVSVFAHKGLFLGYSTEGAKTARARSPSDTDNSTTTQRCAEIKEITMKRITAAFMAGAMVLGLTACGAKETDPMDTFAENTIAETITEATTTEATTEESVVPTFMPEQHAQLHCWDKDRNEADFASDFDFGSNASYEFFNFDGVDWPMYPNYPAGEDIVITFKSDKDFKFGQILKFGSGVDLSIDIFREDADIIYIASDHASHEATTDEWTYTTNINEFVTCSDGVYTITIPADYVTPEYDFYIKLATVQTTGWYSSEEDVDFGDGIEFYVRCFPAQ